MVAGTVRRRGQSWQAILNFRDPRQVGKVVQFTATRRTKREAEKALAELIVRRDREGLVRANQTFGQAVTKWREAKEQTGAPSSLLRYDIALRTHLVPRFGDVQLHKLTADMLDRYYADLRRAGIADNTILWHHQLISNILRYTMRTLRWVGENVALDANPPRRRTTSVQIPEGEQVAKLIEAADRDGRIFGAFVRLAIVTGARRGELCALQWRDVDIARSELTIPATITLGGDGYVRKPPKNNRTRRIAMPAAMVDHLAIYREYRALLAEQFGIDLTGESYLFSYDPTAREFGHPGTMTDKFRKAKRRAGVDALRMHDLRHQAATALLNRGISPRVVSERLGHSRTSTTLDIYAQFIPAADREAADILAGFLTPESVEP
jgi:integrase